GGGAGGGGGWVGGVGGGEAAAAVNLHRPVRGFAAQPVRPVVAHGHLVGGGEGTLGVHQPGGLVDQRAQHLALRLQFNQRELDRLVRGQRPAERLALPGISDRLVDAVLGGSEAGSGLPDPVLVEEVLHYLQS